VFTFTSSVYDSMACDFVWRVAIRSRGLHLFSSAILSTVSFTIAAIWSYRAAGDNWTVGFFAAIAGVSLVLSLGPLMRAVGMMMLVRGKSVEITCDTFGFSQRTAKSAETLPWQMISEVFERDEYLMLRISNLYYLCLPTAGMPVGGRQFVIEKVRGRPAA
jgi:hypothetical protein